MSTSKAMLLLAISLSAALLCSAGAEATEITRTAPADPVRGESAAMTFTITDAIPGERIVLGEELPEGATLGAWSTRGLADEETRLSRDGAIVVWEIVVKENDAFLTYELHLPLAETATFEAVYATSEFETGRLEERLTFVERAIEQRPVIPQVAKTESPAANAEEKPGTENAWRAAAVLLGLFVGAALTALHLHNQQRHEREGHE